MAHNVETWLVTKGKADAGLLAAFSSKDRIFTIHDPALMKPGLLPRMTYTIGDAADLDMADDVAFLENWIIEIDVWTVTDNRISLMNAVDVFMRNCGFSKGTSIDLFESDTEIYHRSLRYVMRVTADDLV